MFEKKGTKDPLGLLTDEEYDKLHEDLAKMAKQRRKAEDAVRDLPLA